MTISGGAGDDIIRNGDQYNRGSGNVSVSGGDGNDYISNGDTYHYDNRYGIEEQNVTLDGGAGDDTFYNHGDYAMAPVTIPFPTGAIALQSTAA